MPFSLKDLGLVDTISVSTGNNYIMALDSGTTSVRAVIVDEYGCIVAQASKPLKTICPHPGWVEQDPMEILASQIAVMMEVQFKSGIHSDSIAAIGISNQRETTVVWDRDSGQPIYNAIVWQCRRTAPLAEQLIVDGYEEEIRAKTGLTPDPYFSGTKIRWILDNVSGAHEAAEAGELMFGTIDTWLIYNLTGGVTYATDYTNASRTMLFNINTLEWDEDLLGYLDIPRFMMPEVRWSSGDFGRVSSEIMTHMPPIMGVAGDQQASLFGHGCFEPGAAKNTYGTGCFMLMNTGETIVKSAHGLVSTIGIAEGGKISYALEGSIFHAGSTIQWLRDKMGIIASAGETAAICRSVESNSGCYFVPAFSGLGAPWWDPNARAMICGLTTASDRATIVRIHGISKLRCLALYGGGFGHQVAKSLRRRRSLSQRVHHAVPGRPSGHSHCAGRIPRDHCPGRRLSCGFGRWLLGGPRGLAAKRGRGQDLCAGRRCGSGEVQPYGLA